MPEKQKVKRKLSAILSADVKGYSLLMADDEVHTIETLTSYRRIISDRIQDYSGRVVDSPGDNILAEFRSVVDALQCAVEIQKRLKTENDRFAEDKKVQFRIGVNIGDVIQEGDRIYGHGVNVAARIEGLSEPGGVCISRSAYDQIRDKLNLGYEYLGEHDVKNIKRPVRVYRVLMAPEDAGKLIGVKSKPSTKKWAWPMAAAIVVLLGIVAWQFYEKLTTPEFEPASVEKMAFPLPEKPSIAVLPFANMSEDPKQEYLSDGITEQIITTLSKVPSMFVIARTSTFAYKDKPVKVQQVSQDLGVRYVLEGSVQRSGDRVRITAQLIDAINGKHMWAQRYDRELQDIFKLQDEITLNIIRSLRIKLTEGEQVNIWTKNWPSNVEYSEKLFEARFYLTEWNKESNLKAKQLFKEAIDLEPEHWNGYSGLAMAHTVDVWLGLSSSPRESLGKALKLCKKALSLDENQDIPHAVIGNIYLLNRKYDLAIEESKRAIALNPNSAVGYVWLGQNLYFSGRYEEAIESIKMGLRLNPAPHSYYILILAVAYREAGRYEEAITEYRRVLKLRPNNVIAYIGLSMTYALAGRFEEAREAYSEVLKIYPEYSFEKGLRTYPYKPERIKIILAAMHKAGLPFKPTLPLPDKPSIAVFAFDNLSGDPEQEYFSDGIAENIITALSKVGELFVIARNSSFTYKGKPVKVQQVGRELGVRYVLEGSVQKAGDRVRITAQLVDAKNGQHLWADKYDRDLKDIFKIQDEITKKIVTSMRLKLTEGEQARLFEKQTKNLDVYLKISQAVSLSREGTKESIIRKGQLAQEIIEMEPNNPVGYRLLGSSHRWLAAFGESPQENLKRAFMLAKKALAIDESDGWSHSLLGYVYLQMRQYEKAIESGKRSVELLPNGAMVHMLYGSTLNNAGRVDEAIAYTKTAIRLNPFPAYWYYYTLGSCYQQKGQNETALKEFQKAVKLAPQAPHLHGALAITYNLLGREEEARASAAKSMELAPYVSVSMISKTSPIKDKTFLKKLLDAMRKAGFPE
jgi:adenylate cyclase